MVPSACRKAGISDPTYAIWRKTFGGMDWPLLTELKALVAALELYMLFLKDSLVSFYPTA